MSKTTTPAILRFRREHAILDEFDRVEAARTALQVATQRLLDLIRTDPTGEWQTRWEAFQAAGGVTVHELCQFMVHGQQIRPVTKSARHLRVLSDSAAVTVTNGGPQLVAS
jgi:hypothetical protein